MTLSILDNYMFSPAYIRRVKAHSLSNTLKNLFLVPFSIIFSLVKMLRNLGKMVQVRSTVLYGYQFPSLRELPGNKDHSSSALKSNKKQVVHEGAPLTKSLIRERKKSI